MSSKAPHLVTADADVSHTGLPHELDVVPTGQQAPVSSAPQTPTFANQLQWNRAMERHLQARPPIEMEKWVKNILHPSVLKRINI